MIAKITGPQIDWVALGPVWILTAGAILTLATGLAGSDAFRRRAVPAMARIALGITFGWLIGQWIHDGSETIISGALRIDDLTCALGSICTLAAMVAITLSLRSETQVGSGEFHSLLLFSVTGMLVLIAAEDMITLFVGIELLSIPLYVLSASRIRRESSLEAGLKYLIVGSVGSATLLYGLALIYGATGATGFGAIASAASNSGTGTSFLFLAGMAMAIVGISFKASAAPFHQWTPDVYEGAPTGVTTFMATATKAAALGILIRLLVGPLLPAIDDWAPIIAVLAVSSIAVGNFGALGQDSIKRMLAWSSVAQVGYLLAAVVVSDKAGTGAVIFYLAVYAIMTVAAFSVVIANSANWPEGERMSGIAGMGRRRPWLAGSMTVAMLALAGLPPTAGFIGKLTVIDAVIAGNWTWLAFAVVIGSLVSLGYYLKVVAAIWFSDPPADAPDPRAHRITEAIAVALAAAALTVGIGILPSWPLDQASRITASSAAVPPR